MDFANIITKKISILIAGHVITEEGPVRHKAILVHYILCCLLFHSLLQVNMANLKDGMQRWLRDHNIKGYYSCTQVIERKSN